MSDLPLIHVRPASDTQASAARRLTLTPGQAAYAGDLAFNVDTAMAAPHSDAMVILRDAAVIGFYRLDYPTAGVAGAPLEHDKVTLRAFALDIAWQGLGLGSAALAACCADLVHRRPERRMLVLTVHAENTVARRLYRRAGFVDTGEVQPGGSSGDLHLMRRVLGVGQCLP